MSDWTDVLKSLAPTVASALLGPMGGVAVSALGSIMGIDNVTQDKIKTAITSSQMTPEQISEIKKLEIQYQENEKERGFKYAELAFQDRDSARKANVAGNTQRPLFWLSLLLLATSLGSEIFVLLKGYPVGTPEIIVGRVLGLLDAVAMMVLSYWYGTSSGSQQKTELLNAKS